MGSAFDFTPAASDPEGDALSFSIENAPSWAAFDGGTGRLSGTPSQADVGTYANIRITVSDGQASAVLGPFTVAVVGTANRAVTLTWTPPTQRVDGNPVQLAGYRVYWGTAPRNYSNSVEIGPNVSSYVVDQLTPATWYFTVTALDAQGLESDYSNEASKRIL